MNAFASAALSALWPGILAAGVVLAVLPWLHRDDFRARAVFAALSIALMWRYALWRCFDTLPQEPWSFDWVVGVIFLAFECLTITSTSISLFFLSRTRNRSAEADANAGWLTQQRLQPLVDVFICTYNEEEAILQKTIVGALAMDYSNFRVWVLDDGRRQWLEALCARKGCRYLTRRDNAHAKAGNINNGLRYVGGLSTPPDLIAILDADFVPLPGFLARTVGLFRDPTVGIVQTPQHFVNPDPIQANLAAAYVLPDEQRYFFDVIMPSKDAWGVCFCCGTSSVIRFSTLQQLGGFPTDSVTEDYLVTLRMEQLGLKTIYLNEKLSIGLAPEGLREYAIQRGRWCLGFIQIFRGRLSPLKLGNRLPLLQRLALIETFLYWSVSFFFRLMCVAVPIAYWLFHICAVNAELADTLSHVLPYFISQTAVTIWLSEKRVLPVMGDVGQLLVAPEIVRAVAIGLIFPKGHKFKVTPKGGDRGELVIQWRLLNRFLILLICTLGSVVLAFTTDATRAVENSGALCLFWSWYNIVLLAVACAVCVEQPRFRKDERVRLQDSISVILGNRSYDYELLDFSASGMRVRGVAPDAIGTRVAVVFGRARIPAEIVRQGEAEFALRVEGPEARETMIRAFYSDRQAKATMHVRGWSVAATVVRRLLR